MNRTSVRVRTEAVDIVARIPVGTSVVIQNTGSALVFLFEGPMEELNSRAPTAELVGYPVFQVRSRTVKTDPIWAWCEEGSSLLAVSW
ncbi:MAG: hypothetical protein OXH08_15390 [Gammaproteobacteria bacterium]|nr:hypothetical protein [Gammaproteobacteria bacterium]MDE0650106.1 hypothetical protein [Gammaproteobacteria bacterium]MYC99202.1 hypothetical protein [Gammaproteobacteria bacterium]